MKPGRIAREALWALLIVVLIPLISVIIGIVFTPGSAYPTQSDYSTTMGWIVLGVAAALFLTWFLKDYHQRMIRKENKKS